MELGTVIVKEDSPSPSKFTFVVTGNERRVPVRQGQFVEVETEEGRVIAFVTNLVKTNRYFMRAESVREYERGGRPLTAIFPADRWEYLIAEAQTLGVQGENRLERTTFPPSPGQKVCEAEPEALMRFLGLNQDGGVELGKLKHHEVPVKLDLTKLLRKHVAVLAMSGAGKCLDYEIPVLLSTGDLIPIGELVDSAIESGKKERNGVEFTTKNQANLSVFTLNNGLKLEKRKIGAFIRRRFTGKMLRIKVRSGKELSLTPDHPLLKFDVDAHWVSAKELGIGDKIGAPRNAEMNTEVQTVDLVKALQHKEGISALGAKEMLQSIVRRAKLQRKTLKELAKTVGISYTGFQAWLKSGNIPLKKLGLLMGLDGGTFSEFNYVGAKWSGPIKAKITVDEDFARFLAYLFAEGHNDFRVLSFTNSDPKLVDDFTRLSEKITGKTPHIVKRGPTKQCIIFSKSAAVTMGEVFGIKSSASRKEISAAIMKSPDFVVREFIRGIFDCDGCCYKKRPTLEIAFSNRKNACSLQALLLRFGIISSIKMKTRKVTNGTRNYWYLFIEGVNNLRLFSENIGFNLHAKKSRLDQHLHKKSNPNLDLIPAVGSVLGSLCGRLRISHSELVKLAGVQASVSRYTRDLQSPSRESLRKIVEALENRHRELAGAIEELNRIVAMLPAVNPADVLNVIRNTVAAQELTYKVISNACGVSAATVGRMIAGRTDVTDNVFKIAYGITYYEPPQSYGLLTTASRIAQTNREMFTQKIRGLISIFKIPCSEVDERANIRLGATRSYVAEERCPPYGKLKRIFDGLSSFARELMGDLALAENEIVYLKSIAGSDLTWDEIIGIEEIGHSGYVYDLSVEGSNNFVAGNLIVHNSHFVSVVVEELLDRLPERGRPAVVIIDVHGEYTGLAESSAYSDRVSVVKGKDLRIGVPNMSPYQFMEFLPEMSGMQARELQRVLGVLRAEMRAGRGPFGLDEVISRVEGDGDIHKHLQQALVGWLYGLRATGIFDRIDNPNWEHVVGPGRAVVVDLSGMTSLRKKQILVAYAARRLFNARKRNRVPPFVICLEEAHQFVPSSESKAAAISRRIIETIAREGRKFYASLVLISQRPVRLSTTVLSQANTNIILRITNPYDLEHIKQSSEAITGEVADMISSLPVGEALIVGEAVNYPIFVRIRRRRSRESAHGASLEEVAKEFERRSGQKREDAKAFM